MTVFLADTPQRRAIRYAAFGHFFSHFAVTAYATIVLILPLSFPSWSYAELLALATPGALLYGLGAPLAGWLGDRWSRSGMIAVFLIGLGGGGVAMGLASGPIMIGVGLCLIGLFGAIYHPVGFAWLMAVAQRPGAAFAVNGLFGTGAIALAPLATGVMIDVAGWRAACLIPAGASVLFGLALWRDRAAGRVAEDGAPQPPRPGGRGKAHRVFAILAATIATGGFVVQGLPYILPKLFDDRASGLVATAGDMAGLGAATAIGGAVTAVYLLGALGNLLGGWLADRVSLKAAYAALWALNAAALGFLAAAFDWPALALAAAVAFLNTASLPVENVLLGRWTPPEWRGRMFGLKFVLAFGVSALAIPAAAAIHAAYGDFALLIGAGAGIAAIVTLIALALPGEPARAAAAHRQKPEF